MEIKLTAEAKAMQAAVSILLVGINAAIDKAEEHRKKGELQEAVDLLCRNEKAINFARLIQRAVSNALPFEGDEPKRNSEFDINPILGDYIKE